MTTTAVISLLTAIFSAVPYLKKAFDSLMVEYLKLKKDTLSKETIKAINDAINNQDQRPLESAEYSGKPSGVGAIRDSLPGVKLRDKSKN